MTKPNLTRFLDSRVVRAFTPLSLVLLLLVAVSGVFIYPFLFSAGSLGASGLAALADKLLITALVAQIGALVPAVYFSFDKEKFSILLTLVVSLSFAVVCSWGAMIFQQVLIGEIGGFSGAVLNVTLSAVVGSVLSFAPALLATFVCILLRITSSLIARRKASGGAPHA